LVRDAQAKGLYRPELDPVVVAVFIQSYTIGRAVDDVVANHMSQDAWNELIDQVIDRVLMADSNSRHQSSGQSLSEQAR
jgi:hypothetical protein